MRDPVIRREGGDRLPPRNSLVLVGTGGRQCLRRRPWIEHGDYRSFRRSSGFLRNAEECGFPLFFFVCVSIHLEGAVKR